MKIERLELKHKELLLERLNSADTSLSEYSFPNLYLFREAHDYHVIDDREVFVRGRTYDGYDYIMPASDIRGMDYDYVKGLMREVDFMFPVPEDWLSFFNPEECSFSCREGDSDYVYTVQKMSTYPGRRLHKKRNLLKQFTETYRHDAKPLTRELLKDAALILRDWQAESGVDESQTDFSPCLEALDLYEELVLCGGIYYADGEPAGFIVGEELNSDTFAVHFAKASTRFKGIYQYIYSSFAGILPPKYIYLNFEQDLEKDVLKLSKASYHPDLMLKKMRVSLGR